MGFRNSILAGLDLVRRAIRSPNFVTGVSGWSINRDGSAEFNDLTSRGALDVGGIPGIWIGPRAHPDFPPALFANANIKAAIVSYIDASNYGYLAVSQGGASDWTEYGIVDGGVLNKAYTLGEPMFVGSGPSIDAFYDMFYRGHLEMTVGSELLLDGTTFTIDGNQAPRGMLDGVRKADGATKYSGTAEALITDASVTGFGVSGRTYEIFLQATCRSTSANDIPRIDIREDNLAGAQRSFGQETVTVANGNFYISLVEYWECTADGNKTFVGTARRAAGAGTVSVVAANAAGQVTPLIMTMKDVTDNATMRS